MLVFSKWAESGHLTTFGTAAYSQSFSQVSANDIQIFSTRQNRAVLISLYKSTNDGNVLSYWVLALFCLQPFSPFKVDTYSLGKGLAIQKYLLALTESKFDWAG